MCLTGRQSRIASHGLTHSPLRNVEADPFNTSFNFWLTHWMNIQMDLTGTSRSKWGGVATAHSLTYYLASSILVNLGGLPRPYPRLGMHRRYKSVGLSIILRAPN